MSESTPERWRSPSRPTEVETDVRGAAAEIKKQLEDEAALDEWARNEAASAVVEAMYTKAADVEDEDAEEVDLEELVFEAADLDVPDDEAANLDVPEVEAAEAKVEEEEAEKTKRPLNEYQQFQKDTRPKVVAAGVTKPTEIMSEVARLWREKKDTQELGEAAEAVAVTGFKMAAAVSKAVDWAELGRNVKSVADEAPKAAKEVEKKASKYAEVLGEPAAEIGKLGSALFSVGVAKAKEALTAQLKMQKDRKVVQRLTAEQMEALLIGKLTDGMPLTYEEVAAIADPKAAATTKGQKALPASTSGEAA